MDNLVSNLIDSLEMSFCIRTVGGQPLIGTDLDELEWKGFCIRAFVCPTTPNTTKLGIFLFPLAKEDLLT